MKLVTCGFKCLVYTFFFMKTRKKYHQTNHIVFIIPAVVNNKNSINTSRNGFQVQEMSRHKNVCYGYHNPLNKNCCWMSIKKTHHGVWFDFQAYFRTEIIDKSATGNWKVNQSKLLGSFLWSWKAEIKMHRKSSVNYFSTCHNHRFIVMLIAVVIFPLKGVVGSRDFRVQLMTNFDYFC